MPFEGSHDSGIGSNLMDFGAGVVNSAVLEPYRAINQLTGNNLPGKDVTLDCGDTIGGKAGDLVGSVIDLLALSRGVDKGFDRLHLSSGAIEDLSAASKSRAFLHRASSPVTPFGNVFRMGTVGGIYGGALTPTEQGQNLIVGRLAECAKDAFTFGAVGGLARGYFNVLGRLSSESQEFLAPKLAEKLSPEAGKLSEQQLSERLLNSDLHDGLPGDSLEHGESSRAVTAKLPPQAQELSEQQLSERLLNSDLHDGLLPGDSLELGESSRAMTGKLPPAAQELSEQQLSERLLNSDLHDGLPGDSLALDKSSRAMIGKLPLEAQHLSEEQLERLYDGLPEHSVEHTS